MTKTHTKKPRHIAGAFLHSALSGDTIQAMLTSEELADFRAAAEVALASRELLEFMAARAQQNKSISEASVARAHAAMQPVAKSLLAILRRLGFCPLVRFRGHLFLLAVVGDAADLSITREDGIVTADFPDERES